MHIKLSRVPRHGHLLVALPAGSPLRRATDEQGRELPCQVIPAPFSDGEGARLLIKAPAGCRSLSLLPGETDEPFAGCDFAAIVDDRLELSLGDGVLPLTGGFDNGRKPDESGGFEAIPGRFGFFTPLSRLDTVSVGPLARVARVTTLLADDETGTDLHATVCYDICILRELPLVLLTACFDTAAPLAMNNLNFAALSLPRAGLTRWEGGLPHYEGDPRVNPRFTGYEYEGVRQHERYFSHYCAVEGEVQAAFVGGFPQLAGDADTVVLSAQAPWWAQAADFPAVSPLFAALLLGSDASAWVGELPPLLSGEPFLAEYTLRSGALGLGLRLTGQGVVLCSLTDEQTGTPWLTGGNEPLFTALLRQTQGTAQYAVRSDQGWGQVTVVPGEDQIDVLLTRPEDPALKGLSAHLTAHADGGGRISWQLQIENHSPSLTLVQTDYPRLSYDAHGITDAFTPFGEGQLYENIGSMAFHQSIGYPGFFGTMQYMAIMNRDTGRGLYFGAHDPEGSFKEILSHKNALTGRGYMTATLYAQGIGEAGNGASLPGQAVWQVFSGHWYDAAMIYKDWAWHHALWVPEVGENGRQDTSEWLKKTPCWAEPSVEDPNWLQDTVAMAQDLGVPVGCHIYSWHQIPFDNDYPHYLPCKQEFLDGLAVLHEKGIRVMPYINGRLWDTRDRGTEDYEFTALGRPGATKDRKGKVFTECYASKEEDGSPVTLAVMCPTTAVWQETQREVVRRLYEEVGVDAVYVDQVAAAEPKLCMDTRHGHRGGGGNYWVHGYLNQFDHLRRTRPPYGGFTSEGHCEAFMNRMDGYLVWQWTQQGQVPAFPAVYAPAIAIFGRNYGSATYNDTISFRILSAQSFVDGSQLGWLNPRTYLDHPCRDYLRRLSQARHTWGEYIWAGQMERPPAVQGDIPMLISDNRMSMSGMLSSPAVAAGQWRRLKDDSRVLLITNMDESPVTCSLCPDLPDGTRLSLHGDLTGEVTLLHGCLKMTLPAAAVVAARVEA